MVMHGFLINLTKKTNRNEFCRFQFHYVNQGLNGSLLIVVNGVIGILLIITNFILLNGIRKSKRRNKYRLKTKLVLLLSSVDLSVGLINIPLEIVLLKKIHHINCQITAVIAFWIVFPVLCSTSIVILISLERYIAVFNEKKCFGIYFKGVHLIPIIIFNFLVSSGIGVWFAFLNNFFPKSLNQYSFFFYFIGTYTITYLTVILLINMSLLIGIKKRMRNSDIQVERHVVVEKRMTKTIMLTSISLIVLYLPAAAGHYYLANIIYIEDIHTKKFSNGITFVYWTHVLCKLSSVLNAAIYITRNRSVHQVYFLYFRSLMMRARVKSSASEESTCTTVKCQTINVTGIILKLDISNI